MRRLETPHFAATFFGAADNFLALCFGGQRWQDLDPMPVIDAAVVGSPPMGGKYPTLYLSGPSKQANRIAELFTGTDVRPTSWAAPSANLLSHAARRGPTPSDHRN
ncbi:hypothetical protein ACFWR9_30710 [Streptomyces sp. NPDC058534]|uniref:hypothetical protein n=1 Tax=Streptomyces sp. NPDC058534 TaxID=3346541 RepID=UPI003658650F